MLHNLFSKTKSEAFKPKTEPNVGVASLPLGIIDAEHEFEHKFIYGKTSDRINQFAK